MSSFQLPTASADATTGCRVPALLPLDVGADRVRPLRWWSSSTAADLAQAVQAALHQWQMAWGVGDAAVTESAMSTQKFRCNALTPSAYESELAASAGRDVQVRPLSNGLWWQLLPDAHTGSAGEPGGNCGANEGRTQPQAVLLEALFGECVTRITTGSASATRRLADELADAAWSDWCGRLTALFASDEDRGSPCSVPTTPVAEPMTKATSSSLPAALLRPWSGSLVFALSWCGRTVLLIVGGEQVSLWRARCGSPALPSSAQPTAANPISVPLVPVLSALAARTLTLRVHMSPVDIDLGTLAALRPGDVLRSTHPLGVPLFVRDTAQSNADNQNAFCHGFLGRQGDQLAVELLRQARPA